MKYVLFNRIVEKVVEVEERVLMKIEKDEDLENYWMHGGEVLSISAPVDLQRFEEVVEYEELNTWEV